jgi:hypothetical protein
MASGEAGVLVKVLRRLGRRPRFEYRLIMFAS